MLCGVHVRGLQLLQPFSLTTVPQNLLGKIGPKPCAIMQLFCVCPDAKMAPNRFLGELTKPLWKLHRITTGKNPNKLFDDNLSTSDSPPLPNNKTLCDTLPSAQISFNAIRRSLERVPVKVQESLQIS